MLRRFTGNRKGGKAKIGVFDGMIVRISVGELRQEMLDFLLGLLEGALRLLMFLLLTSECFCAFRTP